MSFYLSNVVKWNSAYVSVVLLYAIRWRTKCVNECKIAHCAVMCTPFRLCRLPKLQPWEIYYSFGVWAIHKILRNNHIFPFIWMLRNGSEYLLRNVVAVCYKSLEATRSKKALKWCTRHHKSTSFRIFFFFSFCAFNSLLTLSRFRFRCSGHFMVKKHLKLGQTDDPVWQETNEAKQFTFTSISLFTIAFVRHKKRQRVREAWIKNKITPRIMLLLSFLCASYGFNS